MIEFRLILKQ